MAEIIITEFGWLKFYFSWDIGLNCTWYFIKKIFNNKMWL